MEQHYLRGNGQVHQDKSLLFLQLWSPLALPKKKIIVFFFFFFHTSEVLQN